MIGLMFGVVTKQGGMFSFPNCMPQVCFIHAQTFALQDMHTVYVVIRDAAAAMHAELVASAGPGTHAGPEDRAARLRLLHELQPAGKEHVGLASSKAMGLPHSNHHRESRSNARLLQHLTLNSIRQVFACRSRKAGSRGEGGWGGGGQEAAGQCKTCVGCTWQHRLTLAQTHVQTSYTHNIDRQTPRPSVQYLCWVGCS